MKKFITVLLSLSMVLSLIGIPALAETTYNVGDLVWSEDFESFDVGYDYEANPSNGIQITEKDAKGSANVMESASGSKYLYASATWTKSGTIGYYTMNIPAGNAAQGEDQIFTIDVDIKFDNVTTANTSAEYNLGLGTQSSSGSYITVSPTTGNNKYYSNLAINGSRNITSIFKHTVPGEETKGNYKRLFANAWNTYRFIARKAADGNYYADMYVNGAYFYLVGKRNANAAQGYFKIGIVSKTEKAGFAVDNIKCYYGAVESNEYVTKGEVTVDRYTFDECTPGEYRYEGAYEYTIVEENGVPTKRYVDKNGSVIKNIVDEKGTVIKEDVPYGDTSEETVAYLKENGVSLYRVPVAGQNADHAFGVMTRYNTWNMNLDINSGKAGKATGDNSLSVHRGGRVMFNSVNNDDGGNTAAYSTRYGTWVPEGDSLEFSADVLFKDLDENWLFQLTTMNGSRLVAIEVTPTFYSTGHWEKPDDFQKHRQRIVPRIPVNTWVNLRVIITRGTSDTYNKLTIYADDQVVCKDVEITNWYSSKDNAVVTTDAAKGDALAKGFSGIYFQGECDYDNITIKKYLLGQPVPAPAAAPTLVNTSTKVNDYPSLRGKVYTDGRTIQNVVDAFGITGDFVVRDANGNTVTDYTQTADGNYIEIKANGKKYYGAFAANNVVETITETTGTLGGFVTTEDTALTVETVTKGYGRDGDSILIKNTKTVDPEAEKIEYDDTERFIKTLNTDENAYMELSFLADEDTAFYLGYTVYYVMKGRT